MADLLRGIRLGIVNCYDGGVGEFAAMSALETAAVTSTATYSATTIAASEAAAAASAGGWGTAGAAGTLSASQAAMAASQGMSAAMAMKTLLTSPPGMPGSPSFKDTTTEAAMAQAVEMRKRKGAASTILTGPMGVTSPGQTMRTTLGA